MGEEKNIMKKVTLFFDSCGDVMIQVYMSLETLNKIKKGQYEYPFIQYTDGKDTFLERLNNIQTMKILDEYTINFNKLEKEMFECAELNKPYPFKILVDDNNGF